MKHLFTFFILLSLGTHVLAVEPCNEPSPPGDREFYDSIDDLLNQMDGPDLSGLRTEKCGNDEALIKRSAAISGRMIDRLLRKVTGTPSNNPVVMANFGTARGKLECAQRKLRNGVITCKGLGGDLGRAMPLIGTGIAIDQNAHRETNSKISWSNISLEVHLASTILHEMTHKCGTNDKDYFDLPNNPMTTAGDKWANTADTYQNWALWGFCIPGPECAAREARRKGQPLAFED